MGLIWEKFLRPAIFALDAERAHEIGITALRSGLASPFYSNGDLGIGPVERFGLSFPNPIGVAAGFDKNGLVFDQLGSLGFGFVEVGTVTLRPQAGNEKPRLFRLPKDGALINRLGFNNDGAEVVAARLSNRKNCPVLGVNIGKNRDVPNDQAIENYLGSFNILHPFADYIAVNVSSPNTPGLRELQRDENLKALLAALQTRNREIGPKPLLVKIAPDLSESEIRSIVDASVELGIAGIIATNTTINRNGLLSPNVDTFGEGGLSGRPLAKRSNEVIATIYRHAAEKLPVIGVGGVFSGKDAFDKFAAGASLVQSYTGFIYGGPNFPRKVNRGLADALKTGGFSSLEDAVGTQATRMKRSPISLTDPSEQL
jgi:dihydroorotate dehydrogenase